MWWKESREGGQGATVVNKPKFTANGQVALNLIRVTHRTCYIWKFVSYDL